MRVSYAYMLYLVAWYYTCSIAARHDQVNSALLPYCCTDFLLFSLLYFLGFFQVSPIAELNNKEMEPVEIPNLVFKQDGKDQLLIELKGFGYTGPAEEDNQATYTPEATDSELFSFQ